MPPIFGLWCFEVFSYRLRELWRFLMADQQIDNSFRNQDTPVSKDIPIKKDKSRTIVVVPPIFLVFLTN